MNSVLEIGITGKILEGENEGWFLFIKEDFNESGGYLILISKDRNMSKYAEGYDYWAEDEETLKAVFTEAHWKVNWLNNKH